MGKSKSRSGSEVRYLRGRIKQLEAEVKYLKKHQYDHEKTEEVEEVRTVDAHQCTKCFSGILIEYDYHYVKHRTCDNCHYREIEKKK